MTRDTAVTRYGKLSITLHWLMLALFVGVYVSKSRATCPRAAKHAAC